MMTRMEQWLSCACLAVLAGCATLSPREDALVGTWIVEDVAQRGIIDSSRIELTFSAGGRVVGFTGCNRFMANYSSSGNALRLGTPATTRKMCVPALMNQKRSFLDQFAAIGRFRFDEHGALLLEDEASVRLTARMDTTS